MGISDDRGHPPSQQVVVVHGGGGMNHVPHLVLTVLTCGAWLPVWLIVWAFSGRR